MITLTPAAVNEFTQVLKDADEPYVRVSVKGGGCSGFSYQFDFTSHQDDDDQLCEGILLIDPISYQYMQGATIDFKEELIGSSFCIDNPIATTTCGCGSSFGV
jgi:iron-sulfur cluster insertion protein